MKKIILFFLSIYSLNLYSQCTSEVSLSFILFEDIPDFDYESYHFSIVNGANEVVWEYEDWYVVEDKHFVLQLPIGFYKLNWIYGGAQIYNPTLELEYGTIEDWERDSIQDEHYSYYNYFLSKSFYVSEAYTNCNDTIALAPLPIDNSPSNPSDEDIVIDNPTIQTKELKFSVESDRTLSFNQDLDYLILSDLNGKPLKRINDYKAESAITLESIESNTIVLIRTIENKNSSYFKFMLAD